VTECTGSRGEWLLLRCLFSDTKGLRNERTIRRVKGSVEAREGGKWACEIRIVASVLGRREERD